MEKKKEVSLNGVYFNLYSPEREQSISEILNSMVKPNDEWIPDENCPLGLTPVEFNYEKPSLPSVPEDDELFELSITAALQVMGVGTTKRKDMTYSISAQVQERLNEYANRKQVYESDLVELAIMDFLAKYDL